MKNLFKKTMITMCSAVMLMGIGAVSANAATTTVGDFTVDRSKSGYSSPYVVSIITAKAAKSLCRQPQKSTGRNIR